MNDYAKAMQEMERACCAIDLLKEQLKDFEIKLGTETLSACEYKDKFKRVTKLDKIPTDLRTNEQICWDTLSGNTKKLSLTKFSNLCRLAKKRYFKENL